MNGPDSISDPVARRLRCTESSPSTRGSAQLNLAQLNLAQLNSARGWWRGRWVPQCLRVSWLDADMVCQLCMLAPCLRHDNVILIRVWHVGRAVWYSGRVSPSGRRRRVWRVASNLAGTWRRVMTIPTSDFDVVFNSGLVSSSSTQLYGENTILTNFIFEQNQTPLYTMCSDTNCWGFRPVMYWYLLIGGKAHRHNNLRGSANRLHPRERVYIIRD